MYGFRFYTVLDYAEMENFMTDEKDDSKLLDEIEKTISIYNGKRSEFVFTKKLDFFYLYFIEISVVNILQVCLL